MKILTKFLAFAFFILFLCLNIQINNIEKYAADGNNLSIAHLELNQVQAQSEGGGCSVCHATCPPPMYNCHASSCSRGTNPGGVASGETLVSTMIPIEHTGGSGSVGFPWNIGWNSGTTTYAYANCCVTSVSSNYCNTTYAHQGCGF